MLPRTTALLLLCVVACSKGKSDEELRAMLEEQRPLELPPSDGTTLQQAPVIIVTRSEVTYQGRLLATVDDVVNDVRALDPLGETLLRAAAATAVDLVTGRFAPQFVQACHDQQRGIRPSGTMCPAGLAILQADESTDMRVVNGVVNTARRAGYDNLLFAVKQKP